MAPAPFSVVCFRARFARRAPAEQDEANQRLMDGVNASGEAYMSHTRLRGRMTLRLAVGNLRSEERHVRRAWELIQQEAARLGA
jgi:aromatic-L-amino-acid decarboxylase